MKITYKSKKYRIKERKSKNEKKKWAQEITKRERKKRKIWKEIYFENAQKEIGKK